MSDTAREEEVTCPRCGGRVEAAAMVYFDLATAKLRGDGLTEIAELEFSKLNDSFDGHPVAMEAELKVSCAECGHVISFVLGGGASRRTRFHAGPDTADQLLEEARAAYEEARDGQSAVEAWARGPRVARHVSYRKCGPCETRTPHIGDVCAVCGSASGEATTRPVISLTYTEADVRDYADEADVDEVLALRRAREWGRHIQDTAAGVCSEQLLAVIRDGQP